MIDEINHKLNNHDESLETNAMDTAKLLVLFEENQK